MVHEAIVLAAGNSTRIAPVAGVLPKPLIRIRGQPILVRNIRWLASAGVGDVWVNLHYRGELIREALGDGGSFGVRVRYSEEAQILGTAGAVRKIVPFVEGDVVLVVYGDNLVAFDLEGLVAAHREGAADATVAVFDRDTPNSGIAGGRVTVDGGRVVAFVEGGSAGEEGLVNAGVYVVRRDIALGLPEGVFLDWGRDVFPRWITEGRRILAYRISGYCLGMDTPASYERGLGLIESGRVTLR